MVSPKMNEKITPIEEQTLTIQQAIDLAVQHHKAGELPKAESIYNQILQSDPNQPVALHLLGVIAHQVGKNDFAVDLITKALAVKPDYAEAYSNLGNALHGLGKLDEAMDSYNKAIDIKPDNAEAHSNLGNTLKDLGKIDEAVASYNKALDIKPDYADAHSNLGNALQLLGKLEEAMGSYNKAIDIKPDNAEAHYNLGNALQGFAKVDGVVASYNKAIAIKYDYVEASSNLGNTLKNLGKVAEAVASYSNALAIKPDYAEAHNNLGNALNDLGKLEEALISFNKAIAIKPDYAEAYNNLGNALNDLGRIDEAVISYNDTLSIKPDYVQVHENLGVALKKGGNFEEASRSFDLSQSKDSQAQSLECLYSLKKYTGFYLKLDKLIKTDTTNIRAAAISAFASQQLDRADPYPFCNKPMELIRVYESLEGLGDDSRLLQGLVAESKNRAIAWNPREKTTKNGYQSHSDLFNNPKGFLADLSKIIWSSIEVYRSELSSQNCDFIRMFPKEGGLIGWFVRLKKEGHQTEHIHPDGWLSGVIYLKVPKVRNREEGSIEFGLWGYDYPILNENYPRKRIHPKNGDLVLFPSSLFHRTIPFHCDDERVCIAFDLIPI
jgi:tetratricopeptide (TPR) repeat protein